MPAANLVSYAFVTRRVSECDDPKTLAQSIHDQTGDTLYNREGIVFLKCIHILRKVPGALRLLLGTEVLFLHRSFSECGRYPASIQWSIPT